MKKFIKDKQYFIISNMKIIKEEKNENYSIDTKEIGLEEISNLSNETTKKILKLISKESMYPKQIAKKLNLHEQNIYYYIKKLEKSKLIEIERSENVNGTIANFYITSSDSFYFKINDFKKTPKLKEKESDYLKPFIENGKLNALIIVGSPDPHGPQKARSKDGYYGMDLALFLGTYLTYTENLKVKLDTETTEKDLKNNLIIIGGPIVNKVTDMINDKMPIKFDEESKGIYSSTTKKTYFNEEIGMINKISNPFDDTKKILLLAGLRNAGTKSCILAFLKHFDDLQKPNNYNKKIESKIIEGIDLDSDGIVDDCDFLE